MAEEVSIASAASTQTGTKIFGRTAELDLIHETLRCSECSGILIEGEIGVGKTLLARTVFEDAGDAIWICGDRVHQNVEFGVFGLLVDLDGDPSTLLGRIVSRLTSTRAPRAVFVDDAHLLDSRSQEILTDLASVGSIRLVAMSRANIDDGLIPFSALVEDHVLQHLVLGPLPREDYRSMIEHRLGHIVSQAVVDIVDFHSRRNPGRLIELLEYTGRRSRFLMRRGVWILDGLDIDYDARARDYARIGLADHSPKEAEALELVVLAGEVELATLLEAGLGEAADELVAAGELKTDPRRAHIYEAVENHTSDTIRYTTPTGRSRERFDFIDACGDAPSEWAQMVRAEWGLICGAEISESRTIEAALIAARLGDWHRAMRLIAEIPTERMGPHDLLAVALLYCGCNKIPLGLDLVAHGVRTACCAQLVVDSLVVWMNRAFSTMSPALRLADFRTALERLQLDGDGHPGAGVDAEFGLRLLDRVAAVVAEGRPLTVDVFAGLSHETAAPGNFHLLDTMLHATDMLDSGRTLEALALLESAQTEFHFESTGVLHLIMLRGRTLLQLGRIAEAKELMTTLPTHDIAYLSARSGPVDLLWAQTHLLEGNLPGAMKALRAAIESLTYWNQGTQLAIALAEAEYAVSRVGTPAEADDLHARFDELPVTAPYHEYRRALVLRTTARAIRTGEPRYEHELRRRLREAEADGAAAIVVLIRLHLFLHFDEIAPEAMCEAATHGTGREFDIVGRLGAALRNADRAALTALAEEYGPSMPDLAGKCMALAERFGSHGVQNRGSGGRLAELTAREKQISALIVAGRSNAEIASELGVRVRTVEGHTYRLFRKLGVERREQVAEAMRNSEGRMRA
ncbi:helix-turn-helix transcriptional regulator [Brevibacterium sp. CFH 10365]|uniref:helix-turn-helix transcriptional regulator n=1 Tax=Brevibacterium sp. CFH 10365 TaxID=2585207 RepID=UPI0018797B85|nr:LuxR family transcriptional regulator [Brevibacterium sp. CFH 10365]